jgi:hypothetical protein
MSKKTFVILPAMNPSIINKFKVTKAIMILLLFFPVNYNYYKELQVAYRMRRTLWDVEKLQIHIKFSFCYIL